MAREVPQKPDVNIFLSCERACEVQAVSRVESVGGGVDLFAVGFDYWINVFLVCKRLLWQRK